MKVSDLAIWGDPTLADLVGTKGVRLAQDPKGCALGAVDPLRVRGFLPRGASLASDPKGA